MEAESFTYLNESTGLFELVGDDNGSSDDQISNEQEHIKKKTLRQFGKKYGGQEARGVKEKPCNHLAEEKSKKSFVCGAVDEGMRKDTFRYFWKLPSWEAKKAYIKGLVEHRNTPIRRRSTTKVFKKINHFDCFLPLINGTKVRVCKDFFLATFDLKKDTFQRWFKPVRQQKPKKMPTEMKSNSVTEWLNIIPKVPSHYCRASSQRIYVEDIFQSKTHMHKIYSNWCAETGKDSVMLKCFRGILEKEKISVFKPRKDQCNICVGYKEGNIEEKDYRLHILKKDEAKDAKRLAVDNMSSETTVVTMDMQSVLLAPKILVSEQYYKMKLAVHNFTFYVKNSKDVYIYMWHEGEGEVTANNITSCIIDFIKEHCASSKKIVLISDGCLYQNKNKVLCSALSNISSETGQELEQLILEKGHTMMEVDSVHSTLEKLFKPPIFTPANYVERVKQARPSQPYFIKYLDYTFFKCYENVHGNFTSIRPGKRSGDPTVSSIRGLLFNGSEVKYKIRHTDNWKTLPQKRNIQKERNAVKSLYESPLKIKEEKYNSLQSLKAFMHRDYHPFYDNLYH